MLEEVLLVYHLEGPDPFRLQLGVRLRGLSAVAVVELEGAGCAEGLAVQQLQDTPLLRLVDQGEPRVSGAAEALVTVIAQAGGKDQAIQEPDLVLQVERPDGRTPLVVQVLEERLGVVVRLLLSAVVAVLDPGGHLVPVEKALGELRLAAPPVAPGLVLVENLRTRPPRLHPVVQVAAIVNVAVVGGPQGQLRFAREAVGVLEIEEAVTVRGAGSGIAEDRAEGAGWDRLFPRGEGTGQFEITVGEFAEQLVVLVAVGVPGEAAAAAGVELRVIERVRAFASHRRAGEEHAESVSVLLAETDPAVGGLEPPDRSGKLHPLQVARLPGDDVHHAEEGIGPVERRTRPADHLDTLDKIDVDRELGADRSGFENVVVDPVPVHQEQHAGVQVPGAIEAAHPEIVVIAVVGDVDPPYAAQGVGEGTVAVLLDLFGGHDAHRGGRFRHLLFEPRRADHGRHLNAHQFLDTHLQQVGPGLGTIESRLRLTKRKGAQHQKRRNLYREHP